jgi:hypothetical protein
MTQIIVLVGLFQSEHGFGIETIKRVWEGILRENPEPPSSSSMKAYHEHKDLCWHRLAQHFGLIR